MVNLIPGISRPGKPPTRIILFWSSYLGMMSLRFCFVFLIHMSWENVGFEIFFLSNARSIQYVLTFYYLSRWTVYRFPFLSVKKKYTMLVVCLLCVHKMYFRVKNTRHLKRFLSETLLISLYGSVKHVTMFIYFRYNNHTYTKNTSGFCSQICLL